MEPLTSESSSHAKLYAGILTAPSDLPKRMTRLGSPPKGRILALIRAMHAGREGQASFCPREGESKESGNVQSIVQCHHDDRRIVLYRV